MRRSPRLAAQNATSTSKSLPLESHYIVDSAILVSQPKHFSDTLSSPHSHYWKFSAFEHFDQNAETILCSIPFPVSQVHQQYKIYRPILDPKVKTTYKLPNHFDLNMRWCQNGSVDALDKTIKRFSPTVSADSIRFTIGVSAYFEFTISLIDIVNFF